MSFAFLECRETAAPRAPTSPSSHMAGLCRGPQEAPLTGHKLRIESSRQPPWAGGGIGLTAQPLQGDPPPRLEHPLLSRLPGHPAQVPWNLLLGLGCTWHPVLLGPPLLQTERVPYEQPVTRRTTEEPPWSLCPGMWSLVENSVPN